MSSSCAKLFEVDILRPALTFSVRSPRPPCLIWNAIICQMSLILGVHLAKKMFLVSDTRATTRYSDGRPDKYDDDLIKAFVLNHQIDALEAGDAAPASFILNDLKSKIKESSSFDELESIIDTDLKTIISEYVNSTGRYGNVALIIAGFNPTKKQTIESSILGNNMSNPLKARGEGTHMHQSIDQDIIDGLVNAMSKNNGQLTKGMYVEIDYPQTRMITLEIDVRNCTFVKNEVPLYSYVAFHPNQKSVTVVVPPLLLSELEFGERNAVNLESVMYKDAETLMSFVNKESIKYKFATVGGHILAAIVSQNGLLFPTGHIGTIIDGKIVMLGSMTVRNSEKITYKLKDGKTGEYHFVEQLDPSKLLLLGL